MNRAQTKKRGNSIGGSSIKPATDGVDWNPSENVWSEEFLQQAAATFESNMAALLSSLKGTSEESISQDQITATFQMMAEAAAQVMKPTDEETNEKPKVSNDVSAAIAQTIDSLNADSSDLAKPIVDEDLAKMLSSLGLANNQEGASNMFVPFMQNMMQSLLSKEVLYPSLKGIVEKYPEWLERNKATLDKKEFDRFSKQNSLMSKVCTELEKETENDSEEIKKKRFDHLLELMQKMQEFGQPPAELAEDASFGESFLKTDGLAPADPNQCRPM
ncbi:peroxisomal biogenesis factor 19 isoform X2 [Arctopsyche grandis]